MVDKIEIHQNLCNELHTLYENKNSDYGDSFAKLRSEYPESICIRLQDKMNRLKTLIVDKKEQKVDDESIEDTLKDIANYALLELVERRYEERTDPDFKSFMEPVTYEFHLDKVNGSEWRPYIEQVLNNSVDGQIKKESSYD